MMSFFRSLTTLLRIVHKKVAITAQKKPWKNGLEHTSHLGTFRIVTSVFRIELHQYTETVITSASSFPLMQSIPVSMKVRRMDNTIPAHHSWICPTARWCSYNAAHSMHGSKRRLFYSQDLIYEPRRCSCALLNFTRERGKESDACFSSGAISSDRRSTDKETHKRPWRNGER